MWGRAGLARVWRERGNSKFVLFYIKDGFNIRTRVSKMPLWHTPVRGRNLSLIPVCCEKAKFEKKRSLFLLSRVSVPHSTQCTPPLALSGDWSLC